MKRLAFLLVLLLPALVEAQTVRTLCASGCTYTLTEANLQTAINASVGGDSILLQEGTTTAVALTLPSHTGASMVTIRTGVTASGALIASSQFPAANLRMTPALATSSNLATLTAKTNNVPVIRTTDSIGSGGYWTLKHLAVTSNAYGGEALIQLGSDSNTTGEQDSIARIPANFTLEQLYVYGNPVSGQFRGVRIHVNSWVLKDSTIKDIKSTSEGQAVYLNSFSSGGLLSNNFIEGGAEGLLSGGAGGCCHPDITIASAASASSFTLSGRTDLFVGLGLSVANASGVEEWTQVASCGTSTAGAACTSNSITVSPALSATPSVGADVDWGIIPSDVTIEKNTFYKPAAWRSAIVGTPQSVTWESFTTGGTLAAGTYAYRVVARHPVAVNDTAQSAASVEVSALTTGTTGKVVIRWAPVTNATTYRIYGRNAGAENQYWQVTTSACSGNVCSYEDTGTTGTAGNVPTSSGTVWYIKNILELKNARRYTINGNVLDGIWAAAQTGYGIVVTPANTGHGNDSTTVEDITFTNNIIRNAAGVFQVTGRDVSTTTGGQISGRLKRLTISNNLAHDVGSSWGASLRTMLLSTTGAQAYYPNNTASNGPLDLSVTHNSFIQTSGNALLWFDLYKGGAEQAAENFIWRDNLGYKLSNGMTGGNSCAQGSGCFTAHTSGTAAFTSNVVADASCGSYPAGTLCPTSAQLAGEFQDFAAGNFALKPTSTYHNAASDGTDIGANIAAVTALTNIAISGDNTGGTITLPPSIETVALQSGTVGSVYGPVTLQGTCNQAPCTWSTSGQPTGTTLTASTGVLSGTLSAAGTFNFTVTYTDAGGRTASRDFVVTIASVVAQPVGDTPLPSTTRPRYDYQDCGSISSATQPTAIRQNEGLIVCDTWYDLSTGLWYVVTATSPAIVWTQLHRPPVAVVTTKTTAGAVTYTAAELVGGLILRDPNGANRSDVTPTATELLAAIPGAFVGSTFEVVIRNTADAAETITVTAGTGVTLSGTMTIAQNNSKRFKVIVTDTGTPAVTIYSLGTQVH